MGVFGTLGKFKKSVSKYPNSWEMAHKGNPKYSAQYFTSYDTLLKFQGHLSITYYRVFGALRYFREIGHKYLKSK